MRPVPVEHPGAKFCSRCETEKELGEFYPNAAARHGVSPWCRTCAARGNATRDPAKMAAYRAAYVHPDPEAQRAGWRAAKLMRRFGITAAEYDAMVEAQEGRCAACGQEETAVSRGKIKALAVDHDHESGTVRGLLCQRCNLALGHLADDPDRIVALLAYAIQARDNTDSAKVPPLIPPS